MTDLQMTDLSDLAHLVSATRSDGVAHRCGAEGTNRGAFRLRRR
ncbi:MAG: hypothetical protein R2742_00360 [Micropruina glycogenica]